MAVYKVEVIKSIASLGLLGSWRNVYHLNGSSIGDANATADSIVSAEAALHSSRVDFVAKRISDPTHAEPTITTFFDEVSGDLAWTDPPLPMFNVVVVNFRDASGGRGERKYYRSILTGEQLDGYKLQSAVVTGLQASIDALVSSVIAMCAPDGDTIVEGVVDPRVGMRQLSWHRRKRPGFHRGYVAD